MADKDSELARQWTSAKPRLTPGKYLLKVHVDRKDRLKADWKGVLADAELVGETVIDSRWPSGYGRMTVVEASRLIL
jgi:hypothetical protein